MEDLFTWVVLAGATVAAGVALSVRSLALVSRLRGRRVSLPLSCPRTGADVDCVLIYDEKADAYVEVRSCSALGPGVPECDQACRHLLNLDIPLRRGEAPEPTDSY
jgi:hypothetical protein